MANRRRRGWAAGFLGLMLPALLALGLALRLVAAGQAAIMAAGD